MNSDDFNRPFYGLYSNEVRGTMTVVNKDGKAEKTVEFTDRKQREMFMTSLCREYAGVLGAHLLIKNDMDSGAERDFEKEDDEDPQMVIDYPMRLGE